MAMQSEAPASGEGSSAHSAYACCARVAQCAWRTSVNAMARSS